MVLLPIRYSSREASAAEDVISGRQMARIADTVTIDILVLLPICILTFLSRGIPCYENCGIYCNYSINSIIWIKA